MKNKVLCSLTLSILLFGAFLGVMSYRQGRETFNLVDLEGEREYLNVFPIEGVAGDGTQGVSFRIENGEVATKFYPFGTDEIRDLFYARRKGLTGIEKYGYHNYNSGFEDELTAFVDSAPSEDAAIRRESGVHEEAVESGYFDYMEFSNGETAYADKVDVYLNIWEVNGAREARISTGMFMQDKEVFYTRGLKENEDPSYIYSSFNDMEMQSYVISVGSTYYAIVAPTRVCRGETGLFRIQKEDLVSVPTQENKEALYHRGKYGGAEKITAFPVNERSRVLGMYALGDNAFGIFRIDEGKLLFEVYNDEGNLTNEDVLSTDQIDKIDYSEAEVLSWEGGDISVCYKMYEVIEQDKNSQVWNIVTDGIYQLNGEGLKRLKCYDKSAGMYLTACKNNLILDVSLDLVEKMDDNYYSGSQIFFSVINGDTGKLLYQGKLETDFYEDYSKIYSKFDISKNAPYLEEAMRTQYSNGMIEQRQRRFVEIAPLYGKVGAPWLR